MTRPFLFPTWHQWSKWSLPSKLTAIGAWIGILSLVITMVAPLGPAVLRKIIGAGPDSNAGDPFAAGLVAAVQELRGNRECLAAIAEYVKSRTARRPVCIVTADATFQLFSSQYRRIIDSSLGEGKHLYQDLLKVKAAASTLARLQTRADYRVWNTTYEMTIDDLSFLCAFLTWYLASRAHGELQPSEFGAIGLSTNSVLFVPSSQVSRLRMRYFIDGGKPITDYRDYLALID